MRGTLPNALVTRVKWRTLPRVSISLNRHQNPPFVILGLYLEHFTDTCAADIISTVEFDHTGDYLATGDKGGRVVLFERNEQVR